MEVQTKTHLLIHIPVGLKDQIREQAEKEDRSMNYVITKIIREKMEADNAEATPEK